MRRMTSTGAPDYRALLDAPRDDLLIELGVIGHEALPRDALRRGREVYATLRVSLAESICVDPRVRELEREGRRVELLAVLADTVAGLVDTVPVATLAVLLVRDGLSSLCADHWGA